MQTFKVKDKESLKEYLYHSYTHDAEVLTIDYAIEKKTLTICAVHLYYRQKMRFTFAGVDAVLYRTGLDFGDMSDGRAINSLIIEEDYSPLSSFVDIGEATLQNTLYLFFEFFSGDEIHIVCDTVTIERRDYGMGSTK